MTENEALKLIKSLVIDPQCELVKTFDFKATVIKALEDLQQYRAIGLTPKMMKEMIESEKLASHQAIIRGAKLEQYEAIGTIEDFKQAMNFKKYFMELYDEGLEVANWHKNGDLEPLVNFIDEACN